MQIFRKARWETAPAECWQNHRSDVKLNPQG